MATQNWHPDTCPSPGCIIEETVENGTVTFSRVIRKCAAHAAVADNDLYGVLYANADGENKRKNQIEKFLLESGLNLSITNGDGSITWKNGVTYNWAWSGSGASRVLTISVVGQSLTTNQKNQIRTYCDNLFGAGKVVVA